MYIRICIWCFCNFFFYLSVTGEKEGYIKHYVGLNPFMLRTVKKTKNHKKIGEDKSNF